MDFVDQFLRDVIEDKPLRFCAEFFVNAAVLFCILVGNDHAYAGRVLSRSATRVVEVVDIAPDGKPHLQLNVRGTPGVARHDGTPKPRLDGRALQR